MSQSVTLKTMMSELFFCEGFSVGLVIITTIIRSHNFWIYTVKFEVTQDISHEELYFMGWWQTDLQMPVRFCSCALYLRKKKQIYKWYNILFYESWFKMYQCMVCWKFCNRTQSHSLLTTTNLDCDNWGAIINFSVSAFLMVTSTNGEKKKRCLVMKKCRWTICPPDFWHLYSVSNY